MKRIITIPVWLLLLFTVWTACAKSPSEAAFQTIFRTQHTEIILNLPENTEFAYENGTAWITVPSGSRVTGSVDLSPLSSLDGFEQIVFASDVRIETLILPTETKRAEIQTYHEPIELLDASGCASLTRLSLMGPSEKVRLPEPVRSSSSDRSSTCTSAVCRSTWQPSFTSLSSSASSSSAAS